jgi:hypothetical protein
MKDNHLQLGLQCVSEVSRTKKQESRILKLKEFLPVACEARLALLNKIAEEKDPRKKEGLVVAAKLFERAFDLL